MNKEFKLEFRIYGYPIRTWTDSVDIEIKSILEAKRIVSILRSKIRKFESENKTNE